MSTLARQHSWFQRSAARALWLAAAALSLPCAARAEALPTPPALQAQLAAQGLKPQTITVVEPHLSRKDHAVQRRYQAFPIEEVLVRVLGPDWNAQADRELEFKALDGFIARMPVSRFLKYRAFLALGLADGRAFTVDNLAQNEKNVALGPYYLIWDNLAAPSLQVEGGTHWPYQVAEISLRAVKPEALLPAGMDSSRWVEQAALVQKYCLSCHQINGFGGAKMPLNLAVRAKLIDSRTWQSWLLQPQSVKPGTAMPALPDGLSLAERQRIASELHDYLKALPVAP
ncbi:cytochrome c [Paucibacter sp. DJ2R-2]|uniref:cytochrome c n=1 Tax=Paucibacter sp. DJ2R-2 TaxID=2893558 RepID=UPI0021E48828|nr:cytochrome c [Paucibacter sp. DJ2R-2]MCV2421221.1 cytochrome c [Paucibacter sp. DJ4R-1]MCV2439199.1 cytochrome c [Paucibacter sp. DJ2R-2]